MMLMERKFTWVLEEFSSSQDEFRYSQPFTLVGCNWRLVAYPKGDSSTDNRYLSLYLELDPGSLPLGWCRDVEFSISLMNNKGWRRWNKVLGGRCCFTAKDNSWGFNEFLSLFKLRHTEGFLVNDRLVIIAEVHVLPAIEFLSSQIGNQASDAFVGNIPRDSSCQVEQNVESASKEDASEEVSEDDDAAGKGLNYHDEGLDDDDDDDASVNKSQGDSSCQMEQKTENALNENLEDDDISEDGSDDGEASEESSDDDDASEEGSGHDNDYASVKKSQGDSSCQMEQKTENAFEENLDDDNASEESSDDDDASEESSDDDDASEESSDDDDASEESSDDDDSSSHISYDGGREKCPLNELKSLMDGSITVENPVMRCNNVASEIEVSNVDDGNVPREDPDNDDVSSLVSSVSDKDVSSLKKWKSMEDASQKVENSDTGCKNVASVTEASSNLLNEIQLVKETMDFNGFQILSSEVELVSHIFRRHPDIALGFRPKNQHIRRAYMNELRGLIEMLCQSPEKLSEDDLSNADDTLVDLTDVGFKLDWLKTKLNEVSEKKKKEQDSVARIQTTEEQLQKLKLMVLNLESQLQKEKAVAEALAASAPLSFNDIIC